MREAAEKGTKVNEEELTKRMHELLNSKSNKNMNPFNRKLGKNDLFIT